MKLQRVRVQNFRSVVDSGDVAICERLTVIIGKNEQGKTNFLRGITSFNSDLNYTPNDLPNHLRPTLEAGDRASIPVVSLYLVPTSEERSQLKEIVSNIDSIKGFRVVRYFSGEFEYFSVDLIGKESLLTIAPPNIDAAVAEMIREAELLRSKFPLHAVRFPAFAQGPQQANGHIDQFVKSNFGDHSQIDNLIKTFTTALKGIPNQDPLIQDDIATATKKILAKQVEIQQTLAKRSVSAFEDKLPLFIFHSTTGDRIPNEVSIPNFVADPNGTSRGMANLCGAAGLSMQKIQELASSTDTSTREAYEDHYLASISGGINEFWTQETYTVHFRIERDRLSVSISDGTYNPRIPPSDRSDGFQWYLSFYTALLNEVSGSDPTVVLLDNPGLELHADGQRDVKRFLEEKLPPNTQIVYVTHSPAMIDPYNLEQLRKVELRSGLQGTKVEELKFDSEKDLDLLEPVRSAIGASLVSSLVFNEFNVLVEGAADKPILEGAFGLLTGEDSRRINVNGPVSETKGGFLPRFYQQARLPFVVFVDADSGGRALATALKKWGIDEDKIMDLRDVFAGEGQDKQLGEDFELEDLISAEFYHSAVAETYPRQVPDFKAVEQKTAGKRTRRYEKLFEDTYSIGFSKKRVAEAVKKMILDGRGDKETLENLERVTSEIRKGLQLQISPNVSSESPSKSRKVPPAKEVAQARSEMEGERSIQSIEKMP